VTEDKADRVVRVDPSSGKATEFPTPGCAPVGIAVEGESVWLACSKSRTVERMDARDGHREQITPAGSSMDGQPWGIVAGDGGVWVTDLAGGLVWHVSSDGVVQSVELGQPLDGITTADPSGVLVTTTDGLVHVHLADAGN
jgi:sugar lactone lactonase YvrE